MGPSFDSHVITDPASSPENSKFRRRPHSYSVAMTIDSTVHPLLASDNNHVATKNVTIATGEVTMETKTLDDKLQTVENQSFEEGNVTTSPPSPDNKSDLLNVDSSSSIDKSNLPSVSIIDQSDQPSLTNQSDSPSIIKKLDPLSAINQSDSSSTIDQSDQPSAIDQSDPLSRDVQSLLDSLRAPLPLPITEGRVAKHRDSVYFRASVKRRSRKNTYTVNKKQPLLEREEKVSVCPLFRAR